MAKQTNHFEEFKELKDEFKIFCIRKKMSLHEGLIKAVKRYMTQAK